MLYINKEYGFEGKPPYFKEFYEEANKGNAIKKFDYPKNTFVGSQFDAQNSCGTAFISNNGALFGVRVAVLDHDEWIDGNAFLGNKHGQILASTVDDSFTAFKYKDVIIKFSVIDNTEVAFSVESSVNAHVRVIFYPVYFTKTKFKINGSETFAESTSIATIAGTSFFNNQNIFEVHGRYHVYAADDKKSYFYGRVFTEADLTDNGVFGETIYEYNLTKHQQKIYGFAKISDNNKNKETRTVNEIINSLNDAEINFSKNCLMGSGTLAKNATIVARNIASNLVYEPYLKSIVAISSRKRLDGHFALHEFSDCLAAIMNCFFFGDKNIFEETKLLVNEKAAGSTLLLMNFKQGMEDSKLLELYKVAEKDSDLSVKLETEKYGNSEVFSVSRTSLKILTIEVLELVSTVVDAKNTAKYTKIKDELIKLLNDELYSEIDKTYLNKTLEGVFIKNTQSRKFYCLLANAVPEDRLSCVLNDLTNTKTFFSEFGILDRSRASNKKLQIVDAFTNFMIYNGLRRYNQFGISASLAERTAKLWDEINARNIPYALSYSIGGKPKPETEYNLAANLFGLMGIMEVISFDVFKISKTSTLSFGSVRQGQLIQNLRHNGHNYDIKQSEKDTILVVDGNQVFKIDDTTTTVSTLIETENGCEFICNAARNARLEINLPLVENKDKTNFKLAFVLPAGKSRVKIEGAKVNVKPF